MTTPATSITIEEMETVGGTKDATTVDPAQLKLEGDKVPESMRGKTLAEVLELNEKLTDAVKTSEQSRIQSESMLKLAQTQTATPAPVEVLKPEPDLTAEQMKELFEEDPLKAIETMNDQAFKKVTAHFEQRIQPLVSGTANQAESSAREKYKIEFELFGDDIKKAVAMLPDPRAMSNPGAWEDMLSYVRGKPGNFEKLLDHRLTTQTAEAAEAAMKKQIESTGYTPKPSARGDTPTIGDTLDETQKEIAKTLGMSEEDYVKWSKVG